MIWATRLTTKVISLDILLDHRLVTIPIPLDCDCRSTLDQVEFLPCITLFDYVLTFEVCARLEDIGNLGSFLRLERGENLDFREEVFIEPSLARSVLIVSESIL